METTRIKVVITGSTGMVGEGVLYECLQSADVESVLVINRRPCGVSHPKLTEIVHRDFFDISPIGKQVSGYNACFFCLGVSSVGVAAAKYFDLTYTLTMHFAGTLSRSNPDMTFCYVSGSGTDTTEKGRIRWARVKGKTENDLMKLNFQQVFAFRPGFIKPVKGQKNAHDFYKYINWLFPVGRALFPAGFCTMEELGQAMINVTLKGYSHNVIGGKDIIRLAHSRDTAT
ncbi:MAG TPA: hypothetical protein VE870_03960 [Bacteroidales bacterium]|nr:hypothetical protein [Bacteroidales bacterium]